MHNNTGENMLKNASQKNKCADIEYSDDFTSLKDGITNPYCYNFGKIAKNKEPVNYVRLHHKVNIDFFYKR